MFVRVGHRISLSSEFYLTSTQALIVVEILQRQIKGLDPEQVEFGLREGSYPHN